MGRCTPGLPSATKVIDACMGTDEITVEAWVTPANATQTGPTRMVSLSLNATQRNISLMQETDEYRGRLRTSTTTGDGTETATPSGA